MQSDNFHHHELRGCASISRRRVSVVIGILAVCALPFLVSRPQTELPPLENSGVVVEPMRARIWTSTRSVTSLCLDQNGALWAATGGGILRFENGAWLKFDRRDGLPSCEARKVSLNEKGETEVLLPRAKATWRDGKWKIENAAAPPNAPQAIDVAWNGNVVQAAPDAFRIRPKTSMRWKEIALPKNSSGSHASAILVRGGVLWCALYGDGLWSFDGANWKKLDIALPENAREITALAFDEKTKTLWIGTRRDGIWQNSNSAWKQHLQDDEPQDHNAQFLAEFRGKLYMSTLDDGLQVRDENGWHSLDAKVLSSDAPRHLVEFEDKLFVRNGDGNVDSFDGENWTRDVFSKDLPRKKCFALASDNQKVYAAQWGGWSEWDGQKSSSGWTHFLQIPELQGLPIMCLLPDGATVWIGTQSRGVAEYSHATGTIKWHDERDGLPDDWVTCLLKSNGKIFVGTFVGGLSIYNGKSWKSPQQLGGDNVTDLKEDGQGRVLIATRRGVWRRDADGVLISLNQKNSWLNGEAQALCATQNGIWVGARTGLFWLKDSDENASIKGQP